MDAPYMSFEDSLRPPGVVRGAVLLVPVRFRRALVPPDTPSLPGRSLFLLHAGPSSYCMDASFMQLQLHGWGNHAVEARHGVVLVTHVFLNRDDRA